MQQRVVAERGFIHAEAHSETSRCLRSDLGTITGALTLCTSAVAPPKTGKVVYVLKRSLFRLERLDGSNQYHVFICIANRSEYFRVARMIRFRAGVFAVLGRAPQTVP